jgi:hypothetical protein
LSDPFSFFVEFGVQNAFLCFLGFLIRTGSGTGLVKEATAKLRGSKRMIFFPFFPFFYTLQVPWIASRPSLTFQLDTFIWIEKRIISLRLSF